MRGGASQKSGRTHPEITRRNGESRPQNSFLFSPTATQKHGPTKLGYWFQGGGPPTLPSHRSRQLGGIS